jgi:FkbM family methyltransferase
VKAEIGVGIDAHFVGVTGRDGEGALQTAGQKDGWLTTSDVRVADDADILVRHTAIPNYLENAGIPMVMALHGRPESSLKLDESGHTPVVEGMFNKSQDCRYKAFVTFWAEHVDFWSRIVPPEKLHVIPAMVDLMQWRPGCKKFDLGENAGNPNILIADIWRDDVTPFEEIMAVADWIKNKCPNARLHLAAAPMGKGAMAFFHALGREKILGTVCGQMRDIKGLYEACDVVVTPHRIATRIRREAQAMAVPVTTADKLDEWWFMHKMAPEKLRRLTREYAETHYHIGIGGLLIKKLFDKILTPKPKQRKVFLDIGGHLGETVRRFYREVEDARHWEIHTFEPHPECFKALKANLSRMKNVTLHQKGVHSGCNGPQPLFPGEVNSGEGSTFLRGKQTGGVRYDDRIDVPVLPMCHVRDRIKLQEGDYNVLKMNIEGSEYMIMNELIAHDLLKYWNQIYIHGTKSTSRLTKTNLRQKTATNTVA